MTIYIVSWKGLPRHFLKKRGNMTLDHGILKDEYIIIEDISLCVCASDKQIALSKAINNFCALSNNGDYLLSNDIDITTQTLEKMNFNVHELIDGSVFQLKEASSVMYRGFKVE
ncbi:hypothetical protein QJ854_gp027 [Moumouvirus goulette]|uniref:Uncharacterized protein n=1 Tax=Moumouvirus goulette TaxID=1247379 RepID=M1NNW1_9VIRU|nr:hypothetical protein QJ854_gp027 [Moumouvirus goulette]AGF85755.1 hypothetical protein glt_00952 [Moumouvirus goulette]